MVASTLPADAPTSAAAPARSRTPAASHKGDLVALLTLVVLAALVYGLPAVVGHPVVPGDDLTQNLPLRELVGRDLAAGHLPVFDPYIWGGAPLLAGWNAGAAYPFTWLFAVLPGPAAWSLNLVATAAVAGTGCYAFLRASALRPLASWLGAMTFAFGGGMAAQVPHFGLIAGMSWVPLALLAVLRLTQTGDRARLAARLGWAAALSAAVGLVVLAGEPRAIADGAAVIVPYASWRLVRMAFEVRRRRVLGHHAVGGFGSGGCAGDGDGGGFFVGAAVSVVGGTVVGTGLGCVQLLPGLAAVATSQRAHVTATLFSSGSLPVPWLTLLGVPDLLGGSGSLGQPVFFANYNLTEVSGYVGVLPLVGAFALLGRWWARSGPDALGPALGTRAGRKLPEWLIWHLVAALGLLLALGNNTPLWHLLIRLPLFGGQRLQSRSLLVTDLALAVLLAWWVDGWLADGRWGGRVLQRASRRAGAVKRVIASVPAVAIVGVVVADLTSRRGLLAWLGVPRQASNAADLRPWLLPFLGLGVAALLLVWCGRRIGRRWRSVALAAFVVVDLMAFAMSAVIEVGGGGGAVAGGDVGAAAGASQGAQAAGTVQPISALGLEGRFAIYDPTLLDAPQLAKLGVPDGNVLVGTFSVQGYGSLDDGGYAAATGTHKSTGTGQDSLSASAVRGTVLDSLDTAALLVPPRFLARGQRLGAALAGPHWERDGRDGPFAIFRDMRATDPLMLRPLRGHPLMDASVRGLAGLRLDPTSATVSSRDGADVVRAVAAIPGWTATWRPAHGRTVTLLVRKSGVVQSVDVPPGQGTLTWRYVAPGLATGEIVSLVSLALVLAVAAAAAGGAVTSRRRRERRVPALDDGDPDPSVDGDPGPVLDDGDPAAAYSAANAEGD